MRRALTELLQDPVSPPPRRPSRLDVGLALVAGVVVALELVTVDALPGRALEAFIPVAVAAALVFRRTHPFGAFAAAFGTIIVVQWVQYILGQDDLGLSSGAFVLLLPYTLGRYAPGRRVPVGLALLLLTYAGSLAMGELRSSGDVIGALVVLLFPLAVGLGLRALDGRHQRDVAHAQLLERQLLARELHDTVAHRVTAITIQAQAAKAVLDRKPEAAREALGAIETESRRALEELRSLVGTLRGDEAPLRPQGGLDGLAALVQEFGARAHFERVGDEGPLAPAVEHALHRLVRESLHNVTKHGRNVTRVVVRLESTGDVVRLTVTDDGDAPKPANSSGFGLLGMRERATLVGGSLEAGPTPGRGWRVAAVLPRTAPTEQVDR